MSMHTPDIQPETHVEDMARFIDLSVRAPGYDEASKAMYRFENAHGQEMFVLLGRTATRSYLSRKLAKDPPDRKTVTIISSENVASDPADIEYPYQQFEFRKVGQPKVKFGFASPSADHRGTNFTDSRSDSVVAERILGNTGAIERFDQIADGLRAINRVSNHDFLLRTEADMRVDSQTGGCLQRAAKHIIDLMSGGDYVPDTFRVFGEKGQSFLSWAKDKSGDFDIYTLGTFSLGSNTDEPNSKLFQSVYMSHPVHIHNVYNRVIDFDGSQEDLQHQVAVLTQVATDEQIRFRDLIDMIPGYTPTQSNMVSSCTSQILRAHDTAIERVA